MACAKALHAAGATTVDAVVTHALFAPELAQALFAAGIRSVKSTDSVPHPTNAIALDAYSCRGAAQGGWPHERDPSILRRRPHSDRLLPSL